ncbi:hypothetical protein [Streptomyces sp. NPDC088707]|uniref:hypothetical protein n=1 Tax=Streptomyces sp. NPDC088707 TaxID=3365871 RepID=UPI00382BF5C2
MADTTPSPSFPDDLLDLQRSLHQAQRDFSALCATLPWSVEPDPGWPGNKNPHTDQVVGSRPASPGWSEEQKTQHAQLLALAGTLSIRVSGHPFWAKLPQDGSRVDARAQLKNHPQVVGTSSTDAVETAAV